MEIRMRLCDALNGFVSHRFAILEQIQIEYHLKWMGFGVDAKNNKVKAIENQRPFMKLHAHNSWC